MTMADPMPDTERLDLSLLLTRANAEDELTCWLCHGPRCEWETTLRLGGHTIGVGIHETCRRRVTARSRPKP
jgi:hypothetical protein